MWCRSSLKPLRAVARESQGGRGKKISKDSMVILYNYCVIPLTKQPKKMIGFMGKEVEKRG